ncbi:unnamed protein product [Cylindrotheca closterium]|uniref:Uncharacterized protein n=1 Tax=Cylindrotheca closterium TaxID=2856 RepID=A0AAD2CIG0_9STRA|nr:unnamed protein product [Cylindrotheca closterium]
MGRYSSVQSYADNNKAVRTIPYDQATGSAEPKKGKVVVEKVSNPYGSTAGAGSGEFHIYRHARAREMERWKNIDEQERAIKAEREFEQSIHQAKTEEERKTDKRRKKRQREKEARLRKKNLKAAGIYLGKAPPAQLASASASASSTSNPSAAADNDKEEFAYVPLAEQQKAEEAKAKEEEGANGDSKEAADEPKKDPVEEIPNDGSFLEMMKRRLAEEAASNKAPSDSNKADDEDDEDETSSEPPPRKKMLLETRIIDEDDEGPMLPPAFS